MTKLIIIVFLASCVLIMVAARPSSFGSEETFSGNGDTVSSGDFTGARIKRHHGHHHGKKGGNYGNDGQQIYYVIQGITGTGGHHGYTKGQNQYPTWNYPTTYDNNHNHNYPPPNYAHSYPSNQGSYGQASSQAQAQSSASASSNTGNFGFGPFNGGFSSSQAQSQASSSASSNAQGK